MRASTAVLSVVMLLGMGDGLGASGSAVVDLQPRTTAAYDAYVAAVETTFLARARGGARAAQDLAGGADSGARGRIVKVPHGLVHHWRATTRIPGVGLERVVATAQRYDAYAQMYASIVEARLLHRDESRLRVLTRVRESVGPVTVVLEVRSCIRYERGARSVYSIGASERINEVVDAGDGRERLLPVGRDSGYLWRANTFTRFVERAGGVDVELETVGLSRRFPPLLGWLIEPIARRLGRRSVERTLAEFALAVRNDMTPGAAPITADESD